MPRLDTFSVDDLVALSSDVRDVAIGARTMEDAAQAVVGHLFDCLTDEAGAPATALVRFYKTHRFGDLPADLRDFATSMASEDLTDDTRCLTLVATAGVMPEWCDRRRSQGHQAIPLVSEATVAALPMVSRLFVEFGLDVKHVLSPPGGDIVLKLHHQSYNVFHVPDAAGSPWVPAQDFVRRHGIRSALGLGGVLPSGDMFATVMFTTVPVDAEVADLFRSLAPAVKAAVVRYAYSVFGER